MKEIFLEVINLYQEKIQYKCNLIHNQYLQVKTGIPHHRDTADTYLRQIAFGAFILHKQMVEVAQHMSVRCV